MAELNFNTAMVPGYVAWRNSGSGSGRVICGYPVPGGTAALRRPVSNLRTAPGVQLMYS